MSLVTSKEASLLPYLISSLGSEEMALKVVNALKLAADQNKQKSSQPLATEFSLIESKPLVSKPFTISPDSAFLINSAFLQPQQRQSTHLDFDSLTNPNFTSNRSSSVLSSKTGSCTSSSSSPNSEKPFTISQRGRKRIFDDEQRRLRKNNSSKKSRERHTEKVHESRMYLDELKSKYDQLVFEKNALMREIVVHRETLCGQCLDIVNTALRKIEGGEDLVILKCRNWHCSNSYKTVIKPEVTVENVMDPWAIEDEKGKLQDDA